MHLAEFAALEMRNFNRAIDMDVLVRNRPFRDERQGGFVNDVDSCVEIEQRPDFICSEIVGGTGEDDVLEEQDVYGDLPVKRQPIIRMAPDGCKKMLGRDAAVERAARPGRHKDADEQMTTFTKSFGHLLNMSLRSPSWRHASDGPSDLGAFSSNMMQE